MDNTNILEKFTAVNKDKFDLWAKNEALNIDSQAEVFEDWLNDSSCYVIADVEVSLTSKTSAEDVFKSYDFLAFDDETVVVMYNYFKEKADALDAGLIFETARIPLEEKYKQMMIDNLMEDE